MELSCCCRLVVYGSGSVRCVMVRGGGGWSCTTTVTHNTTDHPPGPATTSMCCVDVWLHRQGGGGENAGKNRAVSGANTCIMLVHVCVNMCACPCCPTLAQAATPTQTPSGMHMPRTCCCRCARRMASGLAGRKRCGRRLHSTQTCLQMHVKCVRGGRGMGAPEILPPPCSRVR